MAGDWIKFEIGTSDKPEVWAIAQQLNIDPDAVVGKLLRVWSWFDQHTESGNAPSVTKMLLDRVVGVSGFCNAVISADWMIEEGGEILLTNFDRHNGKTAKTRAVTAKRVANFKEGKRNGNDSVNDKGNAVTVSGALPKEDKREDISNTGVLDNPLVDSAHSDQPKKSKTRRPEYPQWFSEIWEIFPPRLGSNDKRRAFQAVNARLTSGFTIDQLKDAALRYRAFAVHTNRINTEFTLQVATFFGPGDHINNPWSIPNATNQPSGRAGGRGLDADDTSWIDPLFESRSPEMGGGGNQSHFPPVEGDFSRLDGSYIGQGTGIGNASPVAPGINRSRDQHPRND